MDVERASSRTKYRSGASREKDQSLDPLHTKFTTSPNLTLIDPFAYRLATMLSTSLPMKLSSFDAHLSKNITPFLFVKALLLASFIVYGFEIYNFHLSIDEEMSGIAYSPEQERLWWIRIGRWGMAFLAKCLLPFSILPVIPLATALILYTLGLALIYSCWERHLSWSHVFSGLLAVAFPSLIFVLTFSFLAFGIGAGYLFVGLGFALFEAQKPRFFRTSSAACFGFSISIYQSFLPVIFSIYFIRVLVEEFAQANSGSRGHRSLTEHIGFLLTVVIGAALYFAIQQALLHIAHTEHTYIESYWHPELLLQETWKVLSKTAEYIISVLFTGTADFYIDRIISLPVLMAACLATILMAVINQRTNWQRIAKVGGLLFLVLFTPFCLHLINNGQMPIRSVLALPVTVSGLFFLALTCASPAVRCLLVVVGSAAIFQCAVITVRLENSGHLALESDRLLAGRLVDKIELAMAKAETTPRYLEIVGSHTWPENALLVKREHIGASFFEWDGGNIYRIIPFLRTIGFAELQPIPLDKRCSLGPRVQQVSTWPSDGSVQVLDDVVVVKFGDYTSSQKELLFRKVCH